MSTDTSDDDDEWGEIPQEQLDRARERVATLKKQGRYVPRTVMEPTNRDRAVVAQSGFGKPKHLDYNGAPACGVLAPEESRSLERTKIETLRWCDHCEPYVEETDGGDE